MSCGTDKKRVTFDMPKGLYTNFQKVILDKYGDLYGHIGESITEGIQLWVQKENSNDTTSEEDVEN